MHLERLVPVQIRQVLLYDVRAGPAEVCVTTGKVSLPCLHCQFGVNWESLFKLLLKETKIKCLTNPTDSKMNS